MMNAVHREVLDIHHHHLVATLKANDVIDSLLKENAINKYDYDQLRRTEAQGPKAMNRLLLMTLKRRGQADAFPAFQRSLLNSGQKELQYDLRKCELDILEGVVTEHLKLAVNSSGGGGGSGDSTGVGNGEVNGHPGPGYPDSPRETSRAGSPVPVLQKPYSPALKNPPTPRKSAKSPTQSLTRARDTLTPTSPAPREGEAERDRELRELKDEVQELRKSYSRMESELKLQGERQEKEKQEGVGGDGAGGKKKKDGGCSVM